MTPKQTDSELWAMFSNGDGTMGQVGFRDSLHQREQQIYAELMEKIENEIGLFHNEDD